MDKFQKFNIVSLGNWNPKVFTPSWIGQYIFSIQPGSKIDGLLDPENIELNYKYDDITLAPRANSIELSTESIDKTKEGRIFEFYKNVLQSLPFTHIKAVGVNYYYVFEVGDHPNLDKMLMEKDGVELQVTRIVLTKNYTDFVLNVIVERGNDGSLKLILNFHFQKCKNMESYNQKFFDDEVNKMLSLV